MPGRWRTSFAEYQRGILDAISDPAIRSVVWMKSAQVGATEVLNNAIGYYMHHHPAPILILQPTVEMGKAWSKDRLAPMLRDTPCITDLVAERRSKDSENTILHKAFPGGHLTVAGANSAASLASRPIRILLADEIDRYPLSAGSEGDPLSLARKRLLTFWNRKDYECSTPTVRGRSRIEQRFLESDQRYFHIACPECDHEQRLVWAQLKWVDADPSTASYACEACDSLIDHRQKRDLVAAGKWVATKPLAGIAGFHLSELYSPWSTWADMVANFLEAKKTPDTLKTFINTSLGESWEEESEKIDPHSIMDRAEAYSVPNGVLAITCAVDVQDDRLEMEVKGWGVEMESWTLDHSILYGDPSQLELWKRLDEYLQQRFTRDDGQIMSIASAMIDSGGHHTDEVYRFCKSRYGRRIYAIKGMAGVREIISRPTKKNRYNCPLFTVGVDRCKDLIFWRLGLEKAGAGYMHFSEKLDQEFFEQLTAEERREKHVQGRKQSYYHQFRKRNEALDLNVYNIACIELLAPNFEQIEKPAEKKPEPVQEEPIKRILRQHRRGRSAARAKWI